MQGHLLQSLCCDLNAGSASAQFRVSEPQHFYESWTADACGTKRPFLVAL